MAIQNDFRIYPNTKVIRHVSGTTVYSTVAFYSWIMDTFDEPGYLTYQIPIKFNTPTSFTMLNGWFLDNGEGSYILQYLTGGGIDTSGYDTVADPVYMLDMDQGDGTPGWTNFAASDKDKNVEDDTVAVGPLLAYLNDYPDTAGNNRGRIWLRDTRAVPASIADNSEMTVASGTGTGTALGASASGDEIYQNLFTIASFPGSPNPQVYIYQVHPVTAGGYSARVRIAEWSAFGNWDRGSIDILFPVKLGGVAIDSGNIKTFVRQTADTFTFVESTLSITNASRNPIATETSADTVNINAATGGGGEHIMFYDGASSPTISAGDVIQDVALSGGVPPTWYAEVVSHTSWSSSTGYLILRGLRGVPTDPDDIFLYNGTDTTANVNGSVGDTIVSYDAETTGPAGGDLGKPVDGSISTAERVLRAFQDDGTTGKLLLQVWHTHDAVDGRTYTGTNRDFLYKQFVDNDVITAATGGSATINVTLDTTITPTTVISGFSDVTVASMNGTIATGSFSGGTDYIRGERVTWNGGTSEAILIDYVTDTSLFLGNVDPADEPVATDTIVGDLSGVSATASGGLTDDNKAQFNFSLQSFGPDPDASYSVFIEGGSIYNTGRSLTDCYAYLQYYLRDGQDINTRAIYTSDGSTITLYAAEEYIKAASGYSATKPAPFGTLAGGVFFGAQAVWIQGMRSADNNNIKLTDAGGTLREPFLSINLTVSNTRADDRIAVYLEDGSTTLPDKDTYNSAGAGTNAQSDSTFERDSGAMPNDTPTSGTIVVVDVSASEEHRYRFTSRNGTTNPGIFTLPAEITGTATAGTDPDTQTLVDSSKDFSTLDVQVGDIIRRTNNEGGWAYVTKIPPDTANNTIQTTLFYGGITAGWDETPTADNYEINSLVVTYTSTPQDTFFVPYLDTIEDTGTDGSPGEIVQSLTYVSNREVVLEARNVEAATKIVPFKTTATITSSGLTASVIRTTDTVFT